MSDDNSAVALMKDMLGPHAVANIASAGAGVSDAFQPERFTNAALDGLDALSIMQRVRHIADALHGALPDDYATALEIIRQIAPRLGHGFQVIAVTEYIARYGLEHFDLSLAALADVTRYGSAEFAIRPFLTKDFDRTLGEMLRWSMHENEHVRRLSSEGCRPRLPWAGRVPALKDNPTLAIAILEQLRSDPSLYVRKSVANHLNDIAKDCPDWLLDQLETWPADNAHTVWILRHALRTLIKKGDARALALIGVQHGADVTVERFDIMPSQLKLGETISLAVTLRSKLQQKQRLVVDYRVHYVRAAGKTASKVFKLRTFELNGGERVELNLKQIIKDMSVRRHHAGRHDVDLIINGQVMASGAFDLIIADDV